MRVPVGRRVRVARRVPVARRNLFSDRRRAMLGVAGVSTAFLLVLALDGIFAGAMRQITRYIDTSEADVFVAQRGVRTMHMSASAIPLSVVEEIRGLDGVEWAAPILFSSDALSADAGQQLSYVIGYLPGRPGGPAPVAGREPGRGEIVLDERTSATLGIQPGDEVSVLGRGWRVSGLTSGMTNIVNTIAYVRFDDFAQTRNLAGTASYVLVGIDRDRSGVAGAIRDATGLTVLTQSGFSREEASIVRDMSTELMQIMTFAAFLIGLAVTALVLYAATLSRLREVGVMKALGARTRRLASVVAGQAAWTVGGALAIAIPLAYALGVAAGRTGNVAIVIEPASLLRVATGGLFLGALGAVAPLVRVARVDPASVFRR